MSVDVMIIMGSISDYETMKETCQLLEELGISYEKQVISAHRTPKLMIDWASTAHKRGVKIIIAGAGGAAHLPGMVASCTPLPVIGVPIQSKALNGMDSLLSIVQMPAGVPVATMAIGVAGAKNAAIMATSILGISNIDTRSKVVAYKAELERMVVEDMKL